MYDNERETERITTTREKDETTVCLLCESLVSITGAINIYHHHIFPADCRQHCDEIIAKRHLRVVREALVTKPRETKKVETHYAVASTLASHSRLDNDSSMTE